MDYCNSATMFFKFLLVLVCICLCHANDRINEGPNTGTGISYSPVHANSSDYRSTRFRRGSRKISSAIIFPSSGNGSDEVPESSCRNCFPPSNRIPLRLLREISAEKDVTEIFKKYVSNVKINDQNGSKVLTDLHGKPIDTSIGEVDTVTVRLPPNVHSPVTISTMSKGGTASTGKNSIGLTNFAGVSYPFAVKRQNTSKTAGNGITQRIGVQGGHEIERVTNFASCEPELRTARVPGSEDPKLFIYPKCVRIKQCGGCCGSSLLSCEPTEKKQVEVQVQKFVFNDQTGKLDYKNSEKITMEHHLECRCGCRVKAEDCSNLHRHDPDECQCVCKDQVRRAECQNNQLKQWNPSRCLCECREFRDCTSGFIFSAETCECTPETRTTLIQNRRRRNHS